MPTLGSYTVFNNLRSVFICTLIFIYYLKFTGNWAAYAEIHWPKNNRKWDEDLSNTGTRTIGFVHLDNEILSVGSINFQPAPGRVNVAA